MHRNFSPDDTTQVWLVSGCSRGLGRALGEAVLTAGHRLVALSFEPAHLQQLVERFGERVRIVSFEADAAPRAVQAAVDAFGRLDVVVHAPAQGEAGPVEALPDAAFRAQFESSFFGFVDLARAALPVLRQQGRGHFIPLSSIGGRIGTPGQAACQAAQFAVEGFAEVLWREVEPLGLKVTILEPGAFRVDDHAAALPGDPARAAQVILDVAAMPEPPLRLLLGSDAVRLAAGNAMWRVQEDARWRHLSVSTDFTPATPSERAAVDLLIDLASGEAARAAA